MTPIRHESKAEQFDAQMKLENGNYAIGFGIGPNMVSIQIGGKAVYYPPASIRKIAEHMIQYADYAEALAKDWNATLPELS